MAKTVAATKALEAAVEQLVSAEMALFQAADGLQDEIRIAFDRGDEDPTIPASEIKKVVRAVARVVKAAARVEELARA